MCAVDNFKLRRISRLVAGVCVAFTVSVPFVVAYARPVEEEHALACLTPTKAS